MKLPNHFDRLVFLLVISACALGCGPLWMLPGGALSGDVKSAPGDWSSAPDEKVVQLEVRPRDPYSVNVWGVGLGTDYYIASGRGGDAEWAQSILEDPNVRLRIGGTLYELAATRVEDEDEDERARFLTALQQKYDYQPNPEDSEKAWLFRLSSR